MGIDIRIIAGHSTADSSVTASGSVQHVITDDERKTFQLSDKQLKDAVKAYFGKSPNDAYLHSPTPWDDLYKTYNWNQVQMILVVKSAQIISITSEPVIVKTQKFTNTSSKKATFDVSISESVTNSTTSSWSTGGTLSIGTETSVSLGVPGIGEASATTSISYSQSWGIEQTKSETVTVGFSSGVNVELNPHESVLAELSASRGKMKVRIVYKAYLNGQTAINYNPKYKDHHFWGLNIHSVMEAGKVPLEIEITEDIEIGYYSDSNIELKDSGGQLIGSHTSHAVSAK